MEQNQQKKIVETLVLASREPIAAARIAEIVPGCTPPQVKELLKELDFEYERDDRAFEIWEVAGGYQIRTRPAFAGYLRPERARFISCHTKSRKRLSQKGGETTYSLQGIR